MSTIEPAATELTPELLDLMEHEKVIDQGLAGFVDVGLALLAIRDGKKYRYAGYATFEHYCQKRWGMSVAHGKRLVSAAGIARDLAPIGAVSPEREAQVRPLRSVDPDERAEVWAEAVETAGGGQPTAREVEAVVAKRQPPKKDHPAPFSNPILAKIGEHLPTSGTVLDPFAGTGRIHELATDQRRTIGVEIQPKWAETHADTVVGTALDLAPVVEAESVDAIATSPTYGNRMADHHNATDDSVRLTYTHTHGEPLEADNSGTMQWGDEYRSFHRKAWTEAVRVLRPGGTLTINIKDHIRGGEKQKVVAWHVTTLIALGLTEVVDIDGIPTRGLAAGANSTTRTEIEFVITLRKPA
jgi:hypothetical protein